jgi:DNA-binding MarR family transcriptional regulator
VTSFDFDLGVSAGLAIAGSLYAVLWWWARRLILAVPPAPVPLEPPEGARNGWGSAGAALPTATAPGPSPPGAEIRSGPQPPDPTPRSAAKGGPGEAPRWSDGPPGPEPRPAATPTAVRLSQRVILHLYAQGNLPSGAVAPLARCQAGIGEALGITQGGLAAVLRRLAAAGILTVERGHVQGRDRRLKIYRLSSRGLEIARDLRARSFRRRTK